MIFKDLNCEIYGIDISPKTIQSCIENGLGDSDHFKCVNLLEKELDDVFPGVRFDLIIASECMYYFKNDEHDILLDMFERSLGKNGVFYASYPTYDTLIYRGYKSIPKDEDGMIEVMQSGSIDHNLFVNLPYSADELKKKYDRFTVLDVMETNLPLSSIENEKEYHIIVQRRS